MTHQQQINEVNRNIRRYQNKMLCEQASEIKRLRERNQKLADIAWSNFLLARMWRGLLEHKGER